MAVYRFIAEEKATPECSWTVAEMCRTLEVSRSGFYDWASRPPCARVVDDATLAVEIEAIWEASDRTYGSPRVHRWLRRHGFHVSRKRVARIMRTNGWVGEFATAELQDHDTRPGLRCRHRIWWHATSTRSHPM